MPWEPWECEVEETEVAGLEMRSPLESLWEGSEVGRGWMLGALEAAASDLAEKGFFIQCRLFMLLAELGMSND